MHDEVLSSVSLLISRSGKNRKTEGLQGKISQKKTTSCNTQNVCYTRSFDFAIFVGQLRISIFTLLEEIENKRGYPEINSIIPTRSRKL